MNHELFTAGMSGWSRAYNLEVVWHFLRLMVDPPASSYETCRYIEAPDCSDNSQNTPPTGFVFQVASCERKGKRKHMEDRTLIEQNLALSGSSVNVYGVFDGHNGSDCAEFAAKNIISEIESVFAAHTQAAPAADAVVKGLCKALLSTDAKFIAKYPKDSQEIGATAVIMVAEGKR